MKNTVFYKNITDYIVNNRMKFLLCIVILVLGSVIGSLSAFFLSSGSYDLLGIYVTDYLSANTIQIIDKKSVFSFSIYNNIKYVLFMWVSGFWVGLLPLGLIQQGFIGYKLGFTTMFFVQLYRSKGLLFMLVSVIPQLLILVPAVITYSVFNINFALTLKYIRRRGQFLYERKDLLLKNFVFLIIVSMLIVCSSLVDAFIVPPILRPICSFIFL